MPARDPVLDPGRTRSAERTAEWRAAHPDYVVQQSTSQRARNEAVKDLIAAHSAEYYRYLTIRRMAAGLKPTPPPDRRRSHGRRPRST